jgi:hypothetical protein
MKEHPSPNELSNLLGNLENWQAKNKKPTLNEIEEAIETELDKLRRQLIEKIVMTKTTRANAMIALTAARK